MTACEAIEAAVYAQLDVTLDGHASGVSLAPFVAWPTDAEVPTVSLPAVLIACEPFVPAGAGSPLGVVPLRIAVRTHAEEDATRATLQALYELATGAITEANLGPRVGSPWLVCGLDDVPPGEIAVDGQTRTQEKGKSYNVAIARVA